MFAEDAGRRGGLPLVGVVEVGRGEGVERGERFEGGQLELVHVDVVGEAEAVHLDVAGGGLDALARDKVYESMFVVAPLRLWRGLGSPITPVAIETSHVLVILSSIVSHVDSPSIKQDCCHAQHRITTRNSRLRMAPLAAGKQRRTHKRQRITHHWVMRDS